MVFYAAAGGVIVSKLIDRVKETEVVQQQFHSLRTTFCNNVVTPNISPNNEGIMSTLIYDSFKVCDRPTKTTFQLIMECLTSTTGVLVMVGLIAAVAAGAGTYLSFQQRQNKQREQERKERAAVKIQSFVRCKQAATTYKTMKAAAIKIQSAVRRRKNEKVKFQAATKIQSIVRRNQATKKYKTVQMAAIKIQAMVRSKNAKKKFQQIKNATTKIQSIVRRNQAMANYSTVRMAVVKIQSIARRNQAIKKTMEADRVRRRRQQQAAQDRAATVIQKIARGYITRNSPVIEEMYFQQHKAKAYAETETLNEQLKSQDDMKMVSDEDDEDDKDDEYYINKYDSEGRLIDGTYVDPKYSEQDFAVACRTLGIPLMLTNRREIDEPTIVIQKAHKSSVIYCKLDTNKLQQVHSAKSKLFAYYGNPDGYDRQWAEKEAAQFNRRESTWADYMMLGLPVHDEPTQELVHQQYDAVLAHATAFQNSKFVSGGSPSLPDFAVQNVKSIEVARDNIMAEVEESIRREQDALERRKAEEAEKAASAKATFDMIFGGGGMSFSIPVPTNGSSTSSSTGKDPSPFASFSPATTSPFASFSPQKNTATDMDTTPSPFASFSAKKSDPDAKPSPFGSFSKIN